MKICHYNSNQAGAVVGDKVYNIGDALIKAGSRATATRCLRLSTRWRTIPQRCK